MPQRLCDECGTAFESVSGRAPTLTCSAECRRVRAERLRKVRRPRNIPTECSECGGPVSQLPGGRPFLTCGAACFDTRNKRIKREKAAAWRASRRFFCIDCSTEIAGADHARTARCQPCGRKRRYDLAVARRERNRATAKPRLATPKPTPRAKLDNRLRSVYGITIDQYEAMTAAQNGVCGICGLPPEGRGKGNTLAVDHCHKLGHVRMLLCGKCNIAVGLLDDSPERADLVAAYLRRWAVATAS